MSAANTAANAKSEPRAHRFIPDMARQVIFWCAVFAVLGTAGVLISQIGPSWPVAVPSVHSAPTATPHPVAASGEERSTFPSASEAFGQKASEPPAEQPPTF